MKEADVFSAGYNAGFFGDDASYSGAFRVAWDAGKRLGIKERSAANLKRVWTVQTKHGRATFTRLAPAYRVALRDGGQIFTDEQPVTVTRGRDGEWYTLTARWSK